MDRRHDTALRVVAKRAGAMQIFSIVLCDELGQEAGRIGGALLFDGEVLRGVGLLCCVVV